MSLLSLLYQYNVITCNNGIVNRVRLVRLTLASLYCFVFHVLVITRAHTRARAHIRTYTHTYTIRAIARTPTHERNILRVRDTSPMSTSYTLVSHGP